MSAADTPATPSSQAAVDRENPWPGLGSYDESMHAFFFGRDAEVEELLRLVRRDPVALFYGQSGLGKSSLLQAGLFPRLRAADLMPVHIRLRFGSGFPHPVAQILQEVSAAAHRAGGESAPPPEGATLFEYFYDEAHEFWSARNRVLTPVVVFDQFEEIFTLGARDSTAAAQRAELLEQIADLAARRAPASLVARFEHEPELASRYSVDRTRCRLLFSLREDFLPELGSLSQHLPTLASGGLRLQRLRGHQAREVLEKPGAHLLESGATERIIRFVAAERATGAAHDLAALEVEPALLNVVARELNNRRRARGLERISADLVQGARDEILVDFYERAFAGLQPHVREFVEDQLLTTTGFRDSVAVEDAEASYRVSRDTLAALVDRRLLRIDERFQMQRVELTHDLLTGVVKASRDSRREREAVAAERRRVEEAQRLAEQAAADAQAKLRHTRTRALVTIVMGALAVGVGGLMYLNHRRTEEARRLDAERKAAIEARLAADTAREEARANLERAHAAMASSLLIQADAESSLGALDAAQVHLRMGEDSGVFPRGSIAPLEAALNQPRILTLEAFVHLTEPVVQTEFAPDGRLLVLTTAGAVRVASVVPKAAAFDPPLRDAPGALGELGDAACLTVLWGEPALVAVGRRTQTVQLFDLATGHMVRDLPLSSRSETEAAVETDATKAGAAGSPQGAGTSAAALDPVESVHFSPDGRALAAVTAGRTLAVWELAAEATWARAASSPSDSTKDIHLETRDHTTLRSDPAQPGATALLWAFDGSLLLHTAQGTHWVTRASPAWRDAAAIESFIPKSLRGAVRPSADGRSGEWFVSNATDGRLHWLELPAGARPDSAASRLRTSNTLPDTVHSLAVYPGSDLVFAALRNGTIAVCRAFLDGSDPVLRLVQSAAAARSRHITLRVRPDGRFLAAIDTAGAVSLYRIAFPEGLDPEQPGTEKILRADGRWIQQRRDGSLATADGSVAGSWPRITAASTWPMATYIQRVDTPESALTLVLREQGDAVTIAVQRPATGQTLWEQALPDFPELAIARVAKAEFSPDGGTIAIPTTAGGILRLNTLSGERMAPVLEFGGDIQRLAWSGDGRRLAASNDIQEIAIFEPATAARPVMTVHARQSQITCLALDFPGHTLVYGTADRRLVLQQTAGGDHRASLALPLTDAVSHLAIDAPTTGRTVSIAAVIGPRMQVFTAELPAESELEWSTLATIEGFASTSRIPTATDTARLDATWTDDRVSIDAAALLRDTFAWIDSATARISTALTDGAGPEDLERLRSEGVVLLGRFDRIVPRQPGLSAFRQSLARATSDLVEFSKKLAPDLGPLERWPIVAYQQSLHPESTIATDFAVDQALAALVTELGKGAPATPALGDRYREIVRAASLSTKAEQALFDARGVLREHLFSDEQWLQLITAGRSVFLIDREANVRAGEEAMDVSNTLYSELERREPGALTFPIRRGNNLRRMGRVEEALALFNQGAAKAAAAGDGETEAEARVYRAWAYQKMEGRMSDAREDMIAAARLAPHDPWTLRNAIDFLRSTGTPADAVDAAARLVEVQDTAANRLLQARIHLALGDGPAARAAVEPLGGSNDVKAQLDVVDLFADQPAYRDLVFAGEWAYSAYRTTSDTTLEDRALRQLGPLWLAVDDITRARQAFDRLLQYKLTLAEQALVRAFQGRIDMRRRDLERGRESYNAALRLEPDPAARIRRDHGHFREWSGDRAGAIAEFAAASEAGDAQDALVHVLALRRLASAAEAERALEAALSRFPDDRALQLTRARLLLATDPATARIELAELDDGSVDPVALTAAALLGRAAEAAQRNLPRLADTYGSDHITQASLHVLAFAQRAEPAQRVAALREISTAIDRGYRGDVRLSAMLEFEAFANDPLLALADAALAAKDGSRDGLFALARFNLRLSGLVTHPETKSQLLARSGAALSRGVELEVISPADVLADPELAPFAGQF